MLRRAEREMVAMRLISRWYRGLKLKQQVLAHVRASRK